MKSSGIGCIVGRGWLVVSGLVVFACFAVAEVEDDVHGEPTSVPTAIPTPEPTAVPSQAPTFMKPPDDKGLMVAAFVYGSLTMASFTLYFMLVKAAVCLEWLQPKGKNLMTKIFMFRNWIDMRVDENKFVARCGLDAYMSLRMIRLMTNIMLAFTICITIFLVPVYRAQSQPPHCKQACSEGRTHDADVFLSDCVCTGIDRMSMASIPRGSALLWLPVIGIAVATGFVLLFLLNEYKQVVRIRAAYWLSMPPEMFTTLIDDLPTHLGMNTVRGIQTHFEGIFPGQILRIDPVRFHDETLLSQLRKKGRKRMAVYDEVTRLIAFRSKFGEIPKLHSCFMNSCCVGDGPAIDAKIAKLEAECEQLNRDFEELFYAYRKLEEEEATLKFSRPVKSCFVTFSSAKASAVAAQAVLDHRYNVVNTGASEPDDIIWDSLGTGAITRAASKYAVRLLFAVLVISWGAFTAAVGAMTSLESLEAQFKPLREFLHDHPDLRSLAEQSAPLILSALVAIVNPLVYFLARIEARASEGDADQLATVWYFIFLVVQIFIFYGVSGSILNSLTAILNHPSKIVDTLASKIPKNASFYMQFFLTKFVTSLCVDLFRVADVSVHILRRIIFGTALTSRDRRIARCGCYVLSHPSHMNLSSLNGNMLLLFFIATSYVVIQPLLALLACTFFFIAYYVYARLFVVVHMQRFDAGGTLWMRVYFCFVSAILTAQLTLVGLLGLRQGLTQSTAVFVLFLMTAFIAANIDFHYRPLINKLPLDVAAEVDRRKVGQGAPSMATASVWHYDLLTEEDPNYLGRELHQGNAFRLIQQSSRRTMRMSNDVARIQAQGRGEEVYGTPMATSGTEDTDDAVFAAYNSSSHVPLNGNRILMEIDTDSLASRPYEPKPMEYYSYEVPVLREPPVVDLPHRFEETVPRTQETHIGGIYPFSDDDDDEHRFDPEIGEAVALDEGAFQRSGADEPLLQ